MTRYGGDETLHGELAKTRPTAAGVPGIDKVGEQFAVYDS